MPAANVVRRAATEALEVPAGARAMQGRAPGDASSRSACFRRIRGNGRGSQGLCDAPAAARGSAATPASPLKWYGSLQAHARRIAELLPAHDHYVEPFAGSATVLLSKPLSKTGTECLSDINPDIANFWRVVQRPDSRRRLIEQVEMTPYSRAVYRDCIAVVRDGDGNAVRRAWSFLVTCNQGRNGLGAFESRWSYGKGTSNQHADSWARLPRRLQQAGRRVRCVQIECLPYEEILERFNSPNTLVFLDPPFLPETRLKPRVYQDEFTHADHMRLLRIVRNLKARVILCGYGSELYREGLKGWRRTDFKGTRHTERTIKAHKLPRRVLSVWANL